MKKFIAAIDQGTTSTRLIVFNRKGEIIGIGQKEHDQICQKPGWVEHDPVQVWKNTQKVIKEGLKDAGITGKELAAIGVTNQRETVLAWDKTTGKPFENAIVWQCTRTQDICKELIKEGGQDRFTKITGLPVATYFSGPKIQWLIENVQGVKQGLENQTVLFGTMDCWVVWNLTGGPENGIHATDVTNASRTLLMNLETLDWDDSMLALFGIPRHSLPEIEASSDEKAYGKTVNNGPFEYEVPICGVLGDQQAALFGQTCFDTGEAKNTYGTGCFFLLNTGEKIQYSDHGLLTTVGYKIGSQKAVYALEGSIAYAGALVQWVRDNLGLIEKASQIEELAKKVEDNGDVYFVPAFSGLFAPYWRSDARGVIAGLTRFSNKGHIARAVIEASGYQTRDIVDAIKKEGLDLKTLKVDGGMVANKLLMQFLSDILNTPVVLPKITETTALGAAYAAGLAAGVWEDINDLKQNWAKASSFNPSKDAGWREKHYSGWQKAVDRTLNWK